MSDRKNEVDRWLMRAKDVIVIVAAVTPILFFGVRLYRVPDIQEAQAETLKAHDIHFAMLDKNVELLTKLVVKKQSPGGPGNE